MFILSFLRGLLVAGLKHYSSLTGLARRGAYSLAFRNGRGIRNLGREMSVGCVLIL